MENIVKVNLLCIGIKSEKYLEIKDRYQDFDTVECYSEKQIDDIIAPDMLFIVYDNDEECLEIAKSAIKKFKKDDMLMIVLGEGKFDDDIVKYVDMFIDLSLGNVDSSVMHENNLKLNSSDIQILYAIQSIIDIIMKPNLIGLDFNDIHAICVKQGMASVAIAKGEGKEMVQKIKDGLFSNPTFVKKAKKAKSILVNVASEPDDLELKNVSEILYAVRDYVDEKANILFGCSDNLLKITGYTCTMFAMGDREEVE